MTTIQFCLAPFVAFWDFLTNVINSDFGFMIMSFLIIYCCIVIPFWSILGVKN